MPLKRTAIGLGIFAAAALSTAAFQRVVSTTSRYHHQHTARPPSVKLANAQKSLTVNTVHKVSKVANWIGLTTKL